MSTDMNKAIADFIFNRAMMHKKDPAGLIWMGDLISEFMHSANYAETQSVTDNVGKMSFQVQELRPEVLAFALLMEERLREKDAERGGNSWKQAPIDNLRVKLVVKTYCVERAICESDTIVAKNHAVDLANYAMMIADVAGALEVPALERKADNGGAGWVGLDQSSTEPLDIPAFLRKHKG